MRLPRIIGTLALAAGIGVPGTLFAVAASFGLAHASHGWVIALLLVPGYFAGIPLLPSNDEPVSWQFWAIFGAVQFAYYLFVAVVIRGLFDWYRKPRSNAS